MKVSVRCLAHKHMALLRRANLSLANSINIGLLTEAARLQLRSTILPSAMREFCNSHLVPARPYVLAPSGAGNHYRLVFEVARAPLKLLPVPDGTGGQGQALPLQRCREVLHCRDQL